MRMILENPTRLVLEGFEPVMEQLRGFLTYTDKSVQYNLKKLKAKAWSWDMEGWRERVTELESEVKQCLLMQDEDGTFWTYSGLLGLLEERFKFQKPEVVNKVVYPRSHLLAWDEIPPPLYPYQTNAHDALTEAKHAAISLATGGGKSYIVMHLAKTHGLKTVVMVPSTSIANQIYADFVKHFGKKYVGKFYGGKKEYKKLIVIGIDDSLTRITEGDEAWEALSKTQVFIADECHLTAAKSLRKVCFGLCGQAPYRYFVSGTVTRTDGAELLLKAITGPIVFHKTVKELVDEGFLAKPIFKMIRINSGVSFHYDDPQKAVKAHFLLSKAVNQRAAMIANAAVQRLSHPTLILIDEMCQFSELLPYLRVKPAFAYGGTLNKQNEQFVPPEYRGGDNAQLVDDFNNGKIPLLIGTSAISTGTNIKSVRTIVNLMGGKSIIQTSQAIGRGTRTGLKGEKRECLVFDFDVENDPTCHRHADDRAAIYNSIYAPVEFI
jgi:superfamily II DNA or RNA helicase